MFLPSSRLSTNIQISVFSLVFKSLSLSNKLPNLFRGGPNNQSLFLLHLKNMANSSVAEERWDLSQQDQEEEALSLCDLPINFILEDNNTNQETRKDDQETETHQEDFNFNSPWGGIGGSVSPKSEMCAADDIFFQGQILPLRHSVSSESGLISKFRNDIISLNQCRSVSRSESIDWNSVNGFASFSSRSSSSNCSRSSTSHFSSSTTTTTTTATKTARISKPRSIPKNQFQYSNHPSPKPQIRLSSASLGSSSNRNRNSSVWEFFRVGLVRTPGIELQDLKARNSVSRNSSSSSSNSNPNFKNSIKPSSSITVTNQEQNSNPEKQEQSKKQSKKQSFLERKAGLLSGCSCSVSAVKPIPLDNFVVKSRSSTSDIGDDGKFDELMKNTKKRIMVKKQSTKQQRQQGKGGRGKEKHATSRHRTFEWIKELSHSHVDDED